MEKKIILPVFAILSIALILLGTSYAYWRFTYISDKTNIGKSKCLSIELTNQKNEISLTNTYPITDSEAKKLTPYSFTINNTCDTFISYDVNLEMLEGTTMNSKYMAVMINNERKELLSNLDNANTVMSSSVESRKLVSGSLGVGDSVDYTLRLWIDESVTLSDDAQNKTFTSKIVVTAQPSNYSPKEAGYDTLHDAILANEYQTTPEKAIEKINAKGEPDLSKPAPASENDLSDKGLYKSVDDFGDTYYYRGKVTNNYVKFAGFYWRIVRVNGNSSIRLLYIGNNIHENGSINNLTYQFNNEASLPVYVSYMYGDITSSDLEKVYENVNSSSSKKQLDEWYENYIVDKNYASYIDINVGFCGDRKIYTGGNGLQTDVATFFAGYDRYINNKPNFTCKDIIKDLYTVPNANLGNQALIYPIALITYDELAYAGLNSNYQNALNWTYSSSDYWTMTPIYFDSYWKNATTIVQSSGRVGNWIGVNHSIDLKPVINLKSDVKISGGIGTVNDPFVIDTNN